jgi:hypothetical protein
MKAAGIQLQVSLKTDAAADLVTGPAGSSGHGSPGRGRATGCSRAHSRLSAAAAHRAGGRRPGLSPPLRAVAQRPQPASLETPWQGVSGSLRQLDSEAPTRLPGSLLQSVTDRVSVSLSLSLASESRRETERERESVWREREREREGERGRERERERERESVMDLFLWLSQGL